MMLMMNYSARDDAREALRSEQTRLLVEKIVMALRERIGEGLGGIRLTQVALPNVVAETYAACIRKT